MNGRSGREELDSGARAVSCRRDLRSKSATLGWGAPLALALLSAVGCVVDSPPQVVALQEGLARGAASGYNPDVSVFKGLPFAQAPVGDLRCKPSQPPLPWSDPRDATSFGSACWQELTPETSLYSRGMDLVRSEDCLHLNVWSDLSETGRPVMDWFHGGSHTTGHGSSAIFDGTTLATKGAVVVSANYILNFLNVYEGMV